jgi:predicted nuclease with TOPRIM domain
MVKHPKDPDDTSAPPEPADNEWEELTQNRMRLESSARIRAVESEISRIRSRHDRVDRSVVRVEEKLDNLDARVSALPRQIEEVISLKIQSEGQRIRIWVYGGLVAAAFAIAIALVTKLLR